MSLDELKEKIYRPDSGLEKRKHEQSAFDPQYSVKTDAADFQKERDIRNMNQGMNPEQKRIVRVGIIIGTAVVLLIVAGVAVYKIRQSAFQAERTSVSIVGPENVDSNETVTYRVVYKNENRVALKDAVLIFNYSGNFQPESGKLQIENTNNSRIVLGNIDKYSQGEFELVGKFFAPSDAIVYVSATLEYVPENLGSRFQAETRSGINIRTSPLKIEIEAPLEVISGKQIDYVIRYQNLSPSPFRNVRIRAEYSKDFNFMKADPPPSGTGNNVWTLGELSGGTEGKILVNGNISGLRNDSKIIRVLIEADEGGQNLVFGEESKTTVIIATPLFVTQLVGGKENMLVNAGDTLRYTLIFGNTGETGLRNAIIRMKINSRIIDYANLNDVGGFYDAASKTITWKAPEIKELINLDPGSRKEINFSFKILEDIPVKNGDDKNFTVDTLVEIDSPDIPTPIRENKIISSNRLILKLNSPVKLAAKGYYQDAGIANFGPIPPAIGQETSYTLHWQVTNVANDLSDVEVNSYLPTGVKWTGKVFPENESGRITFNERTNQVIWKIGQLKNGVGILTPPAEVSFQVSIIPQINQQGDSVKLLESSVLKATDLFTNYPIEVVVPIKSTSLPEDPSLKGREKVSGQ